MDIRLCCVYVLCSLAVCVSASHAQLRLQSPIPRHSITSSIGERIHPVTGKRHHHSGFDLKGSIGDPVYAPGNGVVIFRGSYGGYGKLLVISHKGAVRTLHAHLSEFEKQVGEEVKRGELIGRIGDTGMVTGPHLHFEVRWE